MTISGKIGFIGGGQMAEALINGMLQTGLMIAKNICVAEPLEARRNLLHVEYKVPVFADSRQILDCSCIILAVKPQVLPKVLDSIKPELNKSHLVISIAAGIPLAVLEGKLSGSHCRVIRVMPNTPALVLEGASGLSGGSLATEADMEMAREIFDAIGSCVVLEEKYLDAVTGLSGSGPAYVFSFLEALIDGGVKVGLTRQVAETLAMQTVLGSVKLAMKSGKHPAELRAMVTSPGGTTIAGLHELERSGFAGILMDAIEAATKRSKELGDVVVTADKS